METNKPKDESRGILHGYGVYKTRTWKYYEPYFHRFSWAKGGANPILDIGCGVGLFLEYCCQHGVICMGLEGSEESVEICKKAGHTVFLHNLSYPFHMFEDEIFQGIFCNQTIEHLTRDAQMNILRESYRVLCRHKPKTCIGQIQVSSPSRHYKAMHCDDHIGLLTIPELVDMLKSVGFTKIDTSHNYLNTDYPMDEEERQRLWEKERPTWLSRTANAIAYKI